VKWSPSALPLLSLPLLPFPIVSQQLAVGKKKKAKEKSRTRDQLDGAVECASALLNGIIYNLRCEIWSFQNINNLENIFKNLLK
jgi:hypothetical protein